MASSNKTKPSETKNQFLEWVRHHPSRSKVSDATIVARNTSVLSAKLLLTFLLVAFIILVTSTISNSCVFTDSQTVHQLIPSTQQDHFSTADDMLYIMYGIGKFPGYSAQLIRFIQSLTSSPSYKRSRNLQSSATDASQAGQSAFVDDLLKSRRNGFFIECGAGDGEIFSNSLLFELERNWTGLLIEANPDLHGKLLKKNRRAYTIRTCLSTERNPMSVKMQPAGLLGGIVHKMHQTHKSFIGSSRKPEIQVNCFPLNAILAALGNISYVDYMSLDVEGAELDILKTISWSDIRIEVLTVEYRIYGGDSIGIDKQATLQKLSELRTYFKSTGIYNEVGILPKSASDADGLDVVYMRQ